MEGLQNRNRLRCATSGDGCDLLSPSDGRFRCRF